MTDFLTTRDAAQRLGISESLVRFYVANGRLRGFRMNEGTTGAWLIPEAALRDFEKKPRKPGRFGPRGARGTE